MTFLSLNWSNLIKFPSISLASRSKKLEGAELLIEVLPLLKSIFLIALPMIQFYYSNVGLDLILYQMEDHFHPKISKVQKEKGKSRNQGEEGRTHIQPISYHKNLLKYKKILCFIWLFFQRDIQRNVWETDSYVSMIFRIFIFFPEQKFYLKDHFIISYLRYYQIMSWLCFEDRYFDDNFE